jgi:hypothetical protein
VSERKKHSSAGLEVLHVRDSLSLCVIYGANYDFFLNYNVVRLGLIGACWTCKIYPVASRKLRFGGKLQVGSVRPSRWFQRFARWSLGWPGDPGHQHASFSEDIIWVAEYSQILLNWWRGGWNELDWPIIMGREEPPT